MFNIFNRKYFFEWVGAVEKINIIGGSILGLLCGVNLLKKGYKVNIYEKRNYIGGSFNSFEGMELSQPQLFHNIILSRTEKKLMESELNIKLKRLNIYKTLNFPCGRKIEIKLGKDNIEKIFKAQIKTHTDKKIVGNLFEDLNEICRIEHLLENKSDSLFFSFNKFIYEKRLASVENKYRKLRVENLVDSIECIYIKEIIKSQV